MGADSIVTAMELVAMGLSGRCTLAVAAALRAALKALHCQTCVICGLIASRVGGCGLGLRWEESHLHLHQLHALFSHLWYGWILFPYRR